MNDSPKYPHTQKYIFWLSPVIIYIQMKRIGFSFLFLAVYEIGVIAYFAIFAVSDYTGKLTFNLYSFDLALERRRR